MAMPSKSNAPETNVNPAENRAMTMQRRARVKHDMLTGNPLSGLSSPYHNETMNDDDENMQR
jgi:hypothetical protein